jgi:hypothetical protein
MMHACASAAKLRGGGEREYHDLATDPYELLNTYASLPEQRKVELRGQLDAAKRCHGAACNTAGHFGE